MSRPAEPTLPELQQLSDVTRRLAATVGDCSFTQYPKQLAAGITAEAAHVDRLAGLLEEAAAQLASHVEEARLDRLDDEAREWGCVS